jgi:acyl carrier protein
MERMNRRDDYLTLVRRTISEVVGVEPTDFDDATDLRDTFDIDSLELMEIGARLETALETRLSLTELVDARTVEQVADMLLVRGAAS